MRLSQYFLPILREDPKEAEIVSRRLMLRAGMIRQSSAGIYSWLPLGLRVLRNIERIARGAIKPHIDRVFPLSETTQALKMMDNREIKGKVVIAV